MTTSLSFALTATPAVEAAYKVYKETGIVSNSLVQENVNRLVSANMDCKKDLNEMALASLTEEHRKELGGGSFADGLPIARDIKAITNIVRFFSRGMTDDEQANFAMEVGRGAALRYRSERCIAAKVESPESTVSAAASAPTATSAAAGAGAAVPSLASDAVSYSKVDGIEDWDGEIVGQMAEGSKFGKLKIGMTMAQVIAELGLPDDQSFSSTALSAFAWTKFGPGRYLSDHSYKGVGRLSYSTEASAGLGEMRLTRITHRRAEGSAMSYATVTDEQIRAYESIADEKCRLLGKRNGDPVAATERSCSCMLTTLKANLKKEDWQQATLYFMQGLEREEVKVVSSQIQKLKSCKQSAP